MNTYTLTPEERFNLILECRNSGLTDYQWCKQKGISTNTLYRWINRFRQNGYPDIPKAKGKSQIAPAKQEVVKLDIVADIPCGTSVDHELIARFVVNMHRQSVLIDIV